ncbi:LysE family translocator [Actinomycetes bacterium KLBMP 9759]
MELYLAFVVVVAVLVAIPGPAVVLVMQTAMGRGVMAAITVALGVFTADLIWVGAAVAGVTALLVTSGPAFTVLRLLGAAYLIYLGLRALLRRPEFTPAVGTGGAVSAGRAFRQGFICDLSNPKTVLVFTSVIPQFIPAGAGGLVPTGLGLTFAVLGLCSLVGYALAFAGAGRIVKRSRIREWLTRGAGGLLVAFGIGLAVDAR